MPTVSVYDMTGKETGKMELSDAVFGIEPNQAVMHSAVVNYLANQRQGTQSTLTRAEVSGGGKKPWKRRGPVTPARVRPALPSGLTAVSPSDPSRAATAMPSRGRCAVSR